MLNALRKLFRGPTHDYELVKVPHSDRGGGYYVRRTRDGQGVRWETLTLRDGLEAVEVAGVSYRQDALQEKAFRPGAALQLIPEPKNPQDPNAVGIWDKSRRVQVGYVPKERATTIAKLLHPGHQLRCVSMWETLDRRKRIALRVLIVRENASIKGIPE